MQVEIECRMLHGGRERVWHRVVGEVRRRRWMVWLPLGRGDREVILRVQLSLISTSWLDCICIYIWS